MTDRTPGPINLNKYDYELSYSGFQTFMKLPVCLTPEDLRAGEIDIAVGGIPWDGTTSSRPGTSLGPRGLRICDHQWTVGYEKYHLHTGIDPFKYLKMADYGDAQLLHGAMDLSFENMKKFTAEILEGGATPIIMGGDHAISWPNGAAIADHFGHGNVSIVHFDAHADTAPLMPRQIQSHGSQFWQLVETGHIKGEHIVQIGLRGYWPGPDVFEWGEEHGVRPHFMAEVQKYGIEAVIDRVVDEIKQGPENVFISLDIDSVDPAYAPGTGSPEPGGFTSREILYAVRRIAHEVGFVGMDLVEVNPQYDVGNNITALLGSRCIHEAMVGTAMRKAGIEGRDYLDPRFSEGPRPNGRRFIKAEA
jgi:agmatinase